MGSRPGLSRHEVSYRLTDARSCRPFASPAAVATRHTPIARRSGYRSASPLLPIGKRNSSRAGPSLSVASGSESGGGRCAPPKVPAVPTAANVSKYGWSNRWRREQADRGAPSIAFSPISPRPLGLGVAVGRASPTSHPGQDSRCLLPPGPARRDDRGIITRLRPTYPCGTSYLSLTFRLTPPGLSPWPRSPNHTAVAREFPWRLNAARPPPCSR